MGVERFIVAGTRTWVCPQGVTSVSILGIGAGAGGQGSFSGLYGGGGGESSQITLTLTAGNSYTIIVGLGGTAGDTGQAAVDGGDSYFKDGASNLLFANGGDTGLLAGGPGGTGGTGDTLYNGGNGGTSDSTAGGGGGSSAGSSAVGGNAGAGASGVGGTAGVAPDADAGAGSTGGNSGSNGGAGGLPGGGGAGGVYGGAGADGAIVITYTDPVFAIASMPFIPAINSGGPRDCQTFGQYVGGVLNSLVRQGIIFQFGVDDWGYYGWTPTNATAGRLLIDQGTAAPAFEAASGDWTITATGVNTVAKVHGVSYPANPTVGTVPYVSGANTVTYVTLASILPSDIAYTDVANLFTVSPQTITADADAHKGLIVAGHSSTQSANLQEWQTAVSGASNAIVDASGRFGLGGAIPSSTTLTGDLTLLKMKVPTNTDGLVIDASSITAGFTAYFVVGSAASTKIFGGQVAGESLARFIFTCDGGVNLGPGSSVRDTSYSRYTTGGIAIFLNNASTNTVDPLCIIQHRSSGTAADGFGASILFQLESSTTNERNAAEEQALWASATDASRKGRWIVGAHDASTSAGSPREVLRVESSGSAGKFGAFATAAVVQQSGDVGAALTAYGWVTSPVYNTTSLSGLPSDATKFLDGTGAWTVPSGGGGTGDMLATAVNADVAATLNSAVSLAYAKWTVIKATTLNSGANWIATLPVPALSGGKAQYVGIIVDPASTKCYTISAHSGENIGPGTATTRVMWAGETALLKTDGTNWFKVAGVTVPMVVWMWKNGNTSSPLSATYTKIAIETALTDNTGLMADTTNYKVLIQRPGNYRLDASVWVDPGGAFVGNDMSRLLGAVYKNGSLLRVIDCPAWTSSAYAVAQLPAHTEALAAADYMELYGNISYTIGGQVFNGGASDRTMLAFTEIPSW